MFCGGVGPCVEDGHTPRRLDMVSVVSFKTSCRCKLCAEVRFRENDSSSPGLSFPPCNFPSSHRLQAIPRSYRQGHGTGGNGKEKGGWDFTAKSMLQFS